MRVVTGVLTIAGANLRRTLRVPSNAFFFVLFPLLMITVLGLAFGGEYEPRVAVVDLSGSTFSTHLVEALTEAEGVEPEVVADRAEAVDAVEEGRVDAAVILPASYDEDLRSGSSATVDYLSRADRAAIQVSMIVRAVVDEQAARLRVGRTLADELGGGLEENVERGDLVAATMSPIEVSTTTVGTAVFPEGMGRFDLGASSQLLLFIFITSMTSAAALIETRRLGVTRRMFATPTRVSTIVAGEAVGRVGVAVVQGLVIMVGAALVFGVSWGDPLGAALVMLVFAMVAGGAGMLLGALAGSTEQSVAVGLLLGLGLSALGGSMMPLEFFSPTMLAVAHATPHAWAADGFSTLVRHGGSALDILPELAVLSGYAAVLFVAGGWALRRRILHG